MKLSLDELLRELGNIEPKSDWVYRSKIPAFRSFDISKDVDLIEEVLRIHGYTNVEPLRPLFPVEVGEIRDLTLKVRNLLTDRGLDEVITFPWLEEELKELFKLESFWEIVNPLNAEQRHMRTSLIPSLVKVLKFNQNNFNLNVAIFEIGRVYLKEGEENRMALLAAGTMRRHLGRSEEWNFLTFKGLIEVLLSRFGIDFSVRPKEQLPYMHPYLCVSVVAEGRELGFFGKLHPQIAEKLELKKVPFVAELSLDLLKELRRKPTFKGLSKFPPVRRDFAFVISKDRLKFEEILLTAGEVFGDLLEEIFPFDLYEGERLKEGEVSIAVRVVLRHPERSLSDDEVNELSERFVKALREKGYALRG